MSTRIPDQRKPPQWVSPYPRNHKERTGTIVDLEEKIDAYYKYGRLFMISALSYAFGCLLLYMLKVSSGNSGQVVLITTAIALSFFLCGPYLSLKAFATFAKSMHKDVMKYQILGALVGLVPLAGFFCFGYCKGTLHRNLRETYGVRRGFIEVFRKDDIAAARERLSREDQSNSRWGD